MREYTTSLLQDREREVENDRYDSNRFVSFFCLNPSLFTDTYVDGRYNVSLSLEYER